MNYERLILESLQSAHPRMLSEVVVQSDLTILGARISLTDLRGIVKRLEAKGQVVVVTTEDATRIKITPDGIARLSE